MTHGHGRRYFTVIALGGLGILYLCLGVGPGDISSASAWTMVWQWLTDADLTQKSALATIVVDLRLPRALLAAVLGAALSVAGVVTQGLFRNALAEPSVLGVNMGAAATAVIGFGLGVDHLGIWAVPLLAAAGAFATLVVLILLAGRARQIVTLLLSGVAISALCAAIITVVLALKVERWEVGLKVMGWLMGSFEGRSWTHLVWSLPPVTIGIWLAYWLRQDLDLLHLGPLTAATLGSDPDKTRVISTASIAMLVGTATALAGVIGFIGLIVPHIARMLVGPRHGPLLTMSALLGGVALLGVDAITRGLTQVILPPGVITALVGAPFFLWLLKRHDGETV